MPAFDVGLERWERVRDKDVARVDPVELTIGHRFNGPPGSGNGGYVGGLVGGLLDGPARVRLHRPPPLGRALAVRRDGVGVTVLDGEEVVATGGPASVEITPPRAPTFAEAEAASRAYPGFRDHAFPGCFVCGPARGPGDGLRIFPGPVVGRDLLAAPWVPDASVVANRDVVRPEFLWAALDCPSGWAPIVAAGGEPMLLGELAVRLFGAVRLHEPCVVTGWALGGEGRKRLAGAALFGADGALRAVGHATWITPARRET
jgi:hypothetical protein